MTHLQAARLGAVAFTAIVLAALAASSAAGFILGLLVSLP